MFGSEETISHITKFLSKVVFFQLIKILFAKKQAIMASSFLLFFLYQSKFSSHPLPFIITFFLLMKIIKIYSNNFQIYGPVLLISVTKLTLYPQDYLFILEVCLPLDHMHPIFLLYLLLLWQPHYWISHRSKITRCLSFPAWLISLSIMP